jgi:hypothetical protein
MVFVISESFQIANGFTNHLSNMCKKLLGALFNWSGGHKTIMKL